MKQKKFILRAKTWHVGYFVGTIEEMCAALNVLGVEVTEIIDIEPQIDMGVTYNRSIETKMKVLGFDAKSQQAFLEEYKQLVKKYSTDKKHTAPKFSYGDVEWFFKERLIETDVIDVLIADDTTFLPSRKEAGKTVYYLSQRGFEPCSELSEELLWDYLWEFFNYARP